MLFDCKASLNPKAYQAQQFCTNQVWKIPNVDCQLRLKIQLKQILGYLRRYRNLPKERAHMYYQGIARTGSFDIHQHNAKR